MSPCQHIFTLCLSDGDRCCNRCGIRRRYPTDNPDQMRRRKSTMPSVDELLGIDPDWTGGLSTDEYMQQQRSRG